MLQNIPFLDPRFLSKRPLGGYPSSMTVKGLLEAVHAIHVRHPLDAARRGREHDGERPEGQDGETLLGRDELLLDVEVVPVDVEPLRQGGRAPVRGHGADGGGGQPS